MYIHIAAQKNAGSVYKEYKFIYLENDCIHRERLYFHIRINDPVISK